MLKLTLTFHEIIIPNASKSALANFPSIGSVPIGVIVFIFRKAVLRIFLVARKAVSTQATTKPCTVSATTMSATLDKRFAHFYDRRFYAESVNEKPCPEL